MYGNNIASNKFRRLLVQLKDQNGARFPGIKYFLPDDFVIATGVQYSVRDFVEACAPYFGMNIVWEGEGLNEIGIDKLTLFFVF